MTRWLAGVFDPHGRRSSWRLAEALSPRPTSIIERGPLCVAYTGPTADSTGTLCLLGGRIDNVAELRGQCAAEGLASEEQLLAAGYARWRAALPEHLLGDFAIAIWDQERGEGLLARDQLGVHCLYLHDSGGALFFATEIRQLLTLLPHRPAPDRAGVAHWVAASHRPGTATLYEGVRRLEPGAAIRLTATGARECRYWSPRFVEPSAQSEAERTESQRAALASAVRHRLAPNAGTGVLMSGGLDSASVAAIAAKQAPGRVSAYSAVFPEHPAVDESHLIAQLRRALRLPGINAEVRAGGLLASALESQSCWQLPLASWGEFWSLPLLRAAASCGVETMLGGDGGDELFDTRAFLLADRLRAGDLRAMFRATGELPWGASRPRGRTLMRATARFGVAGAVPYSLHARLHRPFAARELPAWLTHRATEELLASDDPLAWKRRDGPRWWAHAVDSVKRIEEVGVFEMHRRRGALAGLETRHPLLDLRLVELVLKQPPRATFDRRHDRPTLRSAMCGLLPDAVRLRPNKSLFDSLIVDSLTRADGAVVRRLLTDPGAELGGYVDLGCVQRSLLDNDSLRSRDPLHWMLHIWRLTTAECWLRAQSDPLHDVLSGTDASRRRVVLRDARPTRVHGRSRERGERQPLKLQPQD